MMDTQFPFIINDNEVDQNVAAALLKMSLELNTAADNEALLDVIRRGLADDNLSSISLLYIDVDDAGQPASAEFNALWQHSSEPVLQPGMRYALPEFPFTSVLLQDANAPQLISHTDVAPMLDDHSRELMLTMNIHALVIVPLVQSGHWIGLLVLTWAEAREFTPRERTIYSALPALLTPVVSSRRLLSNLTTMVQERTAALEKSEAFFRAIITNASDVLNVLGMDGTLLYESPSFERTLGYPVEDVIGKSAFEFVHPDDATAITEKMALLLADPTTPQTITYRWRHQDGSWRYLETVGINMLDTPAVNGIVTSSRDVTDRRQMETRLRESQQMLQLVLDTIPVRVFWKDTESRFLGCNRLFAQDMGAASPQDLIGKSDYDFTTRELADAYRVDDLEVMQSQQSRLNYEERLQRSDGSEIWLRTSKIPLLDSTGQCFGMLGSFDDISAIRQAETERDRLQEQIIEAQRQALAELSTPIIPIMDRIIVMPLVGAVDSIRARDIMRSLLEGISTYRAQIAILDITGVPLVDSGVADHLNRTIQAARLKGAQTIITGVSDAVAETIVDLGIDWGTTETLRDLQTGLMSALSKVGLTLTTARQKASRP